MSSYTYIARATFKTPFGRRMVPESKDGVVRDYNLWEDCDEQARASRQAFIAHRLRRTSLAASSSPRSGASDASDADPADTVTERASHGQSGSLARGVDRPRGDGVHDGAELARLAAARLAVARLSLYPPSPLPIECPVSMAFAAEEAVREQRKAAEEADRKQRAAVEEADRMRRKAAEDAMDQEEEDEVCAMLADLSLERDEEEELAGAAAAEVPVLGTAATTVVDVAPPPHARACKVSRTPMHLQRLSDQRQAHVRRVVLALLQPEEQTRRAAEVEAAALVGLSSKGQARPGVQVRVASVPVRKVVSISARRGQAGVGRV
ncbi:uncharacterized protein BXZ73DRAFT_103325 [Epithele typhae]|uniref:uncharacterized protein n=1 Tax=Epithele typhae TaxID=378194 RepID=UPI0020073E46|nr:uncharacterized protein BXZ73DRAFT_103325 [Epithele typhae]KAH9925450.1 hypothetical protein BXZ73DRAFT_103325 [Epithele typhae]